MDAAVLAIDVGGTKLSVAIVEADGEVVGERRCPTPSGPDGEVVFAALATLVRAVLDDHGPVARVGVGCGGPMRAGGTEVSTLNIPSWRGFPLRGRLVDLCGTDQVSIDNDAKALALGEGWLGAARGVDDYLAMVVSTGIGAGIVLGGELLHGADGNAGHIGHLVVVPDGRAHAGIRGSLEGEASGTAIAARIGRPAADAPVEERRRCGTLVGRAVGGVANLLDLRLAVIGGSVALGFGDDFFGAAQQELDRVARLEHSTGARIVPVALGARAPLVGAAALTRR